MNEVNPSLSAKQNQPHFGGVLFFSKFDEVDNLVIVNHYFINRILFIALALMVTPLLCISQNNILTGKWRLTHFAPYTNSIKLDTQAVLNFKDSAMIGRMSGHSRCNSVGGDYRINEKGEMNVPVFGGTKKACPGEGKFWDAMHLVTSYKRVNDTLTIFYNNDTEKMIFVRMMQ